MEQTDPRLADIKISFETRNQLYSVVSGGTLAHISAELCTEQWCTDTHISCIVYQAVVHWYIYQLNSVPSCGTLAHISAE